MITRCEWADEHPLLKEYHDREWGVPVHDDRMQFEFLILEGAQAGLSWLTILKRRENYRKAFDNFDPLKIVENDEKRIMRLLANEGIIRNKLKVRSVVKNAIAILKIQEDFGSFDAYLWNFVNRKPIINTWKSWSEIPATTAESEKMSKDLKKRGFSFVGPTICYAHMQAVGMVNDHIADCFRYNEVCLNG